MASSWMSAMTTLAPASASASAMPKPMPEAAPVTIAVLPEMSFIREVPCGFPTSRAGRSADRGAEDAHIVAAGDLARLLGVEAAAQHRGDKMHPAGIILDATARVELVGADADMIHANDVGHLLQAVDISVEARKEMPDPD